jgi:hypothetical protein
VDGAERKYIYDGEEEEVEEIRRMRMWIEEKAEEVEEGTRRWTR